MSYSLVVSHQYSVFSIQSSVFSRQYSVVSIQSSVFGIQYSVVSIQYSVFGLQYSVFGLRSPVAVGSLTRMQKTSVIRHWSSVNFFSFGRNHKGRAFRYIFYVLKLFRHPIKCFLCFLNKFQT